MSRWNQLLESLHSSLIDELVVRVSQPKPELGLPRRENGLLWPNPSLGELYCLPLALDEANGWVFLGADAQAEARLGAGAVRLWSEVLARARKSEFTRRRITVTFGEGKIITRDHPGSHPKPRMVIWIPFGMLPGWVMLGVGI